MQDSIRISSYVAKGRHLVFQNNSKFEEKRVKLNLKLKRAIWLEDTCFLSLEEALLASLAVCTAASADAASGVARRTSQISCWHSLCSKVEKQYKLKNKIRNVKLTFYGIVEKSNEKRYPCNMNSQAYILGCLDPTD